MLFVSGMGLENPKLFSAFVEKHPPAAAAGRAVSTTPGRARQGIKWGMMGDFYCNCILTIPSPNGFIWIYGFMDFIWVFPKIGVPQNRWFIVENLY